MKSLLVTFGMLAFLIAPTSLQAQESPQFPVPQKEHEWLEQFVGEWDSEAEGKLAPDQPAIKCKGTMKSRMLGGFWVISESEADMLDTKMTAIQTIGYDTKKKKYVGTWVDSMTNHMWKYEGTVDKTGKILTLEAEGPSMMDPAKTTRFRDAYEFKSKDHIVATSSAQNEDGQWATFMTGEVKRKKK